MGFNISILDSDGKWIIGRWLNDYCDYKNATILSQKYCLVKMQVFQSTTLSWGAFGLKPGDII